jgi:2-oxoglutarate ferredoxin oxidoreductase subunit delta
VSESGDKKTTDRSGPVKKKKTFEHVVFKDWCKSCGICSAFCPRKVIGRNEQGSPVFERPEDCIGCRFCELHCPDFAITVKEKAPAGGEGGHEKEING